jgi:hypothetical protein
MFANGLAVLSSLFLLQAEVQFEAGTRIESRAGEAPTGTRQVTSLNPTTGQPDTVFVPAEQAQIIIAAIPILGLRWLDGADDLRVNSATRILWRPVPLLDSRPLFLETLDASHARRLGKRGRWQLGIQSSYGEQDYTSLQTQLVNQPALPLATTMFMVNATADASWRSSRRTTVALKLGAIYRRSLDTQSVVNGAAGTLGGIPTQTTVSAVPGLDYALSRRSTLQAFATITDTDFQNPLPLPGQPIASNLLLIQPQVGLREALSSRHQLNMAVGFSYAVALRQSEDAHQAWYPSPLLQIDLNSILQRTRTAVVRSSLGAGMTAFVDPVLGAAVSRGIAQASMDVQWGLWSGGARCAFVTDLSGQVSTTFGDTPDQTSLSVDIPFRYRVSRRLMAEFGGRYSERAPYLGAKDFAWHNRELWFFLNLIASARPSSTRS